MYLLWLIVFGGVTQHPAPAVSSHHQPAKVTQVHLQTSSLGQADSFWITTDSIGAEKWLVTERGEQHRRYARAITPQEYRWLAAPFTPQVVAALKPSYTNPRAGDDAGAFTLLVYTGQLTKSIHLYAYRLAPVVAFTKRFNNTVPKEFQVQYP